MRKKKSILDLIQKCIPYFVIVLFGLCGSILNMDYAQLGLMLLGMITMFFVGMMSWSVSENE